MEITPKTKIDDLLKTYPQLEAFLMALNPKYKKLKNPVLRRTVAKIATLTQVAKIGGYEPLKLVNLLRGEVGQPPLGEEAEETKKEERAEKPAWADRPPQAVIDANALLEAEKNPLAEASAALRKLQSGEVLRIDSDFLPQPLIDTFQEQGHETYAHEENGAWHTYILKK
ncbi:DUF1858 domain-containing protein [Hydrogenimonas sp.]